MVGVGEGVNVIVGMGEGVIVLGTTSGGETVDGTKAGREGLHATIITKTSAAVLRVNRQARCFIQ
jgi:hypothetical protein